MTGRMLRLWLWMELTKFRRGWKMVTLDDEDADYPGERVLASSRRAARGRAAA